ncbi:phosphorylase b kinase regulatory subunit alpha, liver isoform-like isoform X2 [Biomphalaria glabrata]|uniref:Phosphorylase b kinase regulatory subunit n=1 Tax=Biomphalaria glabrata TaxID=6526 RepID=A0A9W3B2E6_BIOGL|nr:phosphorylase b kinase regulatory subunit alpha, liver isoform-like isoform X2 [Biomphalaria glabrata]
MRSRSNSGLRLDYYQRLVNRCILRYQNVSTGLIACPDSYDAFFILHKSINVPSGKSVLKKTKDILKRKKGKLIPLPFEVIDEHHDVENPASGLIAGNEKNHSWVRDNVYCIMAVWGLALAYRKTVDLDEDRAKAYELEKAVVEAMRGLLRAMLMQSEKVESFKRTQSPRDALHAKYSSITGKTVVGDYEWGHLQIDATSLYLLALAQMTASGLVIVFTLDEVAFVQNLVFYIEAAYRTPDYGIWERGDKTNHGLPELNASSIGMAKAALEAINELDLFGSRGGPASVIHVLPDEAQQCQAILQSMLPRESISKEVDAALLTVISFPAFAVDDPELIALTHKTIKEKLEGPYGCCRFLRDGYKTAKEDARRLHYEPWELMVFEKIECQWPLFFAYLVLDGLFNNNQDQVAEYQKKLDNVLLKTEDGIPYVPELYAVPRDSVEKEYENPNSQARTPAGKMPHMWGQSMYILGRLMIEGFLSPGELDPLNRRHVTETKPDVVVQVVLLAEDSMIQDKMALHGIELQTVAEVAPIQIHPARILSKIYSLLGKNKRLGLTGRASSSEIGLLATSKLYMLHDKILAFVPQLVDQRQFYLGLDMEYLVDDFKTKIDLLSKSWKGLGRPLMVYNLTRSALDNYQHPPNALLATIKKLQSGYISGTRVHLGKLSDFLHTSCITKLSFLRDVDDYSGKPDKNMMDLLMGQSTISRQRLLSESHVKGKRRPSFRSAVLSVHGIVRRSRSIQIDPDEIPDLQTAIGLGRKMSVDYDETLNDKNERDNEGDCESKPMCVTSSPSNSDIVALNDSVVQPLPHHLRDESDSLSVQPSPHTSPKSARKNLKSVTESEDTDITELIEQLKQTANLQEQADIIHYLFMTRGPEFDTHIEENRKVPVKELLVELYEKAGHWKQWWLVRHTAGMLRKRVEDLALAATDLLVRQKQLSVGLPPDHETTITSPLPPDELAAIIYEACGEDHSTASLTQEILVYLAMFIRTEPQLFDEMLRLRVGLIIQVMASELSRTLQCSGEEASDHLLNLSPFEMKTLLHHILSGKEFVINSVIDRSMTAGISDTMLGEKILDLKSRSKSTLVSELRQSSFVTNPLAAIFNKLISFRQLIISDLPVINTHLVISQEQQNQEEIADRQGQWLRRRRLDGSLNRVPLGFYPHLWELLTRCRGLLIKGNALPSTLTREMTKGEFKFALQVEMVLNRIPQPEYRQLMVEAMMVLTMLVEYDNKRVNLSSLEIEVDKIVHEANNLFIKDLKMTPEVIDKAMGAANISLYFYDSAPSGRFGSMAYMCRALVNIINLPVGTDNAVECTIS